MNANSHSSTKHHHSHHNTIISSNNTNIGDLPYSPVPVLRTASVVTKRQSLRRVMAVKHGDKLFLMILAFICLEISTFSRLYLKISPSFVPAHDQYHRNTSEEDQNRNNNNAYSHINNNNHNHYDNVYLRSAPVPDIEWDNHKNEALAGINDMQLSERILGTSKPRVVFLSDPYSNDNEDNRPTFPKTGRRLVEAMGDLNCCAQDPFHYVKPEEKPFYEECTPMADWQTKHYPTCNMLHELPLVHDDDTKQHYHNNSVSTFSTNQVLVTLLNTQGSWRSVWKVTQQQAQQHLRQATGEPESIVLKTLRYNREFNHESFQLQYVDSMAMERLTSSPFIADEYGFCGQSVLTEFAPRSGRELIKNKRLKMWQRVQIAHDLAAALSHMHSIDYPHATNATFTHNDINIANTIQGDNGRIKFNDFNIGVLMRWNKTQPCGSPVRFSAPLWRSPEEIINPNTTTTTTSSSLIHYVQPEKSDTYALGNLLFQVLTTHQPWTWLEPGGPFSVEQVIQKKLAGELPHIPSKYRGANNNTGTLALYHATLACYTHNPQDRPTSFELVSALKTALVWTKKGLVKTDEEMRALFTFHKDNKHTRHGTNKTTAPRRRTTATVPKALLFESRQQGGENSTTGMRTQQNRTITKYSSSPQSLTVLYNKTKELIQVKSKQVRDAEAMQRSIALRQVGSRPRINTSPSTRPSRPTKMMRGTRAILIVDSTHDEIVTSKFDRTSEESILLF